MQKAIILRAGRKEGERRVGKERKGRGGEVNGKSNWEEGREGEEVSR